MSGQACWLEGRSAALNPLNPASQPGVLAAQHGGLRLATAWGSEIFPSVFVVLTVTNPNLTEVLENLTEPLLLLVLTSTNIY